MPHIVSTRSFGALAHLCPSLLWGSLAKSRIRGRAALERFQNTARFVLFLPKQLCEQACFRRIHENAPTFLCSHLRYSQLFRFMRQCFMPPPLLIHGRGIKHWFSTNVNHQPGANGGGARPLLILAPKNRNKGRGQRAQKCSKQSTFDVFCTDFSLNWDRKSQFFARCARGQ